MAYEQLKLENQLCFPLYAASRLIIRAYQEDMDKLGITYPQYLVLMVLWEQGELSVNEIAEQLILNTNTVTPLLKRMEAANLLTRKPSSNDLRKVVVRLTEKGEAMKTEACNIPLNLIEKLQLNMDENQLKNAIELKDRLNQLINTLETIEKEKSYNTNH